MRSLRLFILILLVTALAGCYRQSDDTFETIGGQEVPTLTTEPSNIIIIDPNASPDDAEDESVPPDGGEDEATTSDQEDAQAFDAFATPTATLQIFIPPSSTLALTDIPTPVGSNLAPTLLPTATQPQIITPEPLTQLTFPTATATPTNDPSIPSLVTPTDLAAAETAECTHVVRSGDTLFRIAFNNNVALADLLRANSLVENSIIQPGQVLQIPNCVPSGNVAVPPASEVEQPIVPPGSTLYTVQSGDTLGAIARRFGVTIEQIVAANSLTNPDRLSVGQQLVIPNQP